MDERLRILGMVERGEISVEEAARQLEALKQTAEAAEAAGAPAAPVTAPGWLGVVWQAVFGTGVALVIGGALLVAGVYIWGVASGWLACGWPLFALGVLVVAVGAWLPRARWLYLRVQQSDGPNFFFAMPLPLGLVAWGLRIARPFVPRLRETAIDEVIMEMAKEVSADQPLVVDVDEGEQPRRVQIYFG